ncbi:hypothetical protein C0J45_21174 [Silurus meridionalis]|nr:hypothetical protein C0J45_21174 [Silurus meridionalis]
MLSKGWLEWLAVALTTLCVCVCEMINGKVIEMYNSVSICFCFLPEGHTEFIYTVKEVLLNCSTNKWEISTESDNKIDVSCTVECVHHESHVINLNNIQKSCTKSYSDKVGENCPLKASCGFFRCVSALDSGFLFPFKPSPNTVTSYVVAHANEESSPYAVGIGEEEITFKSKREAIKQGGEEEAAYSVVKQNDLYESGA